MFKRLKGFTLLEMLVVMAIVASASLVLLPLSFTQIRSGKATSFAQSLASLIFSVQQNAYARVNDKTYGVSFSTNTYTIFTGDTLATATNKEVITLDSGLTFSTINFPSDLIFTKGTFRPNSSGSVIVSDGTNRYQISVSSEGFISYVRL